MPGLSRHLATRRPLFKVLGILCCALIIFSGAIQAGHIHADSQALQTDCALCHVAHLVVQPAAPQSLSCSVCVVASIAAALQPASAGRNYPVVDSPGKKRNSFSGGHLCARPCATFIRYSSHFRSSRWRPFSMPNQTPALSTESSLTTKEP